MVARQHETGACDIGIGIFNLIDGVYLQALFIAFTCSENNIGQREQWVSLSERQFLAYFRMNVPEDGKECLRDKFREEPRMQDQYTMRQFAAMTHHFHRIFGLGTVPEWTETPVLKTSKVLDIAPLVDRLIRRTMAVPQAREAHLRGLEAAAYAEQNGAVALLEQRDYQAVGKLVKEGMIRANRQRLAS